MPKPSSGNPTKKLLQFRLGKDIGADWETFKELGVWVCAKNALPNAAVRNGLAEVVGAGTFEIRCAMVI